MPLGVGTALLALDKKGGWGHARVLNVRVTIDIDSSSSQDSGMQDPIVPASWPAATTGSTSAVYVKFRGFAEKHNAWIEVGKGRLRPTELGVPSPDEEIYDVERVVDVRPGGKGVTSCCGLCGGGQRRQGGRGVRQGGSGWKGCPSSEGVGDSTAAAQGRLSRTDVADHRLGLKCPRTVFRALSAHSF
jgi:hypothetical protein